MLELLKHITNFQGLAMAANSTFTPKYSKICQTILGNGMDKLDLTWIHGAPAMRKHVGAKKHFTPIEVSAEYLADDWENTMDVHLRDLKFGRITRYEQLSKGIGYKGAAAPDLAVKAALLAGSATKCWDGQYFFDTDHPIKGGVQSNTITASGTSLVNFQNVVIAVWPRMRKFVVGRVDAEDVQTFGQAPDTVVCPAALEFTMRTLFSPETDYLSGTAVRNLCKNLIKQENIIVDSDLDGTDANDVFFFNTEGGDNPDAQAIIIHDVEPFELITYGLNELSEKRFEEKIVSISGERTFQVIYGAYWRAIRATQS
ncbi:MAG: Mu-like prophage major head subunit gpT [bacterium ADurb.Bin236]|nr:MAG: Mu-like prophage major head subunit gpT [bacterium ADurb.Bin236]